MIGAFIVGLLLAPIGAIIGSLLLTMPLFLIFADASIRQSQFIGMTLYGAILGLFFATPVTTVVIPTIYLVLRRRSALSLKRLTIWAAPFGVVPVLIASFWVWRNDRYGTADRDFWAMMLAVAADGVLVAALCANGFGRIMRAFQPQAWEPAPAEPAG